MRQLLDPFALRAALAGDAGQGGNDWGRLLSVLGVTAALLRDMGAPARVEAALAAQEDVGRQLAAATDKCADHMTSAAMQCVGDVGFQQLEVQRDRCRAGSLLSAASRP